ncbi:PiggyBac transposable element-derived protein 4 [Plakobranchus ocellatus]|uniref:PiggyBac transposable element-derived protein 4 n=1 Tax=Plakobranchus ocellatus TaxID=259542 RepID=A0AAV3YI10_9GAST|nr:PiggyBac transposable element-derived protein 4 [Plakobranchus ocellatus]
MELTLPHQNKGRNVTMDNFFSDADLADKLLQRKTTIVGTVRRIKCFLPNEFLAKKKLKLNDSLFGFSDNKCILSYQWHKNKNVILLSTMHTQPVILPGEKRKPEIVMYYNSTKGGRCGLCHWKVNKKGTVKCHVLQLLVQGLCC